MKYLAAAFFAVVGLLPLYRAVSGLRSGVADIKLYLPVAHRSQRPALYWAFICLNIALVALCAALALLALSRLR